MYIIRPIRKADTQQFLELISGNTVGITNLPKNRLELADQINRSEASFKKQVSIPSNEEYRFVLEDVKTGKLGGTSGLLSCLDKHVSMFYTTESVNKMKVLKIMKPSKDVSETCALYLHPSFRHSGLGRLLSLSRFLFIASFPERVGQQIVALLRAYIDDQGKLPFWEGIGKHFFQLSFQEVIELAQGNLELVTQLLPQFPIYIDLLPEVVQKSIGKCHDETQPALKMLMNEGFHFNNQIDVFDGGPLLTATSNEIRTVKSSVVASVKISPKPLENNESFLLSNQALDFRACLASLRFIETGQVEIIKEVASALQVQEGDFIRYARLK